MSALKSARFLALWGLLLAMVMLATLFVHESGHGFGARLEGKHVSTGFDKVGDPGKRPRDPDFRSETVEPGQISSQELLGPLSNWALAILFTVLLLRRTQDGPATRLIGVTAVASAYWRLLPMSLFFLLAPFHIVATNDEVMWGMRAVSGPGLSFPMPEAAVRELLRAQPSLFLSEPLVYFWPGVSLTISLVCFVMALRHLLRLYAPELPARWSRWLFGCMPVLSHVLLFVPIYVLDQAVRITW